MSKHSLLKKYTKEQIFAVKRALASAERNPKGCLEHGLPDQIVEATSVSKSAVKNVHGGRGWAWLKP